MSPPVDHLAERGEAGHAGHPRAPGGIAIRHRGEFQPRHFAGEHAGSVTRAHVARCQRLPRRTFFHVDSGSEPPGRAGTDFLMRILAFCERDGELSAKLFHGASSRPCAPRDAQGRRPRSRGACLDRLACAQQRDVRLGGEAHAHPRKSPNASAMPPDPMLSALSSYRRKQRPPGLPFDPGLDRQFFRVAAPASIHWHIRGYSRERAPTPRAWVTGWRNSGCANAA